jgi:putative transcriptional regulator
LKIKQVKKVFQNPTRGSLLVSEPFLEDINFRRSVVIIAEHTDFGAVGFILNKPLDMLTGEIAPDLLQYEFPIFHGGPLEPNSLHFIHKHGDEIPGSMQILPNIYWGGDISYVSNLIETGTAEVNDFRFFLGYSGWEPDQIKEEIEEKSWWVALADESIIFDDDMENMWGNVVKLLGEDFAPMANSPEDLSWN